MPRPIRVPFTIPPGAQFGAVRAGGLRRHAATDYHVPIGTPIYGTGDGGRVTEIGYNGDVWAGLGHYVGITYPDGSTRDAHMQARTPLRMGDPVGPTTLVGFVGLTGNAVNASPPGSHDHHERRKPNGLLVNPEVYYGGSATASNGTITPIDAETEDHDMPELTALIFNNPGDSGKPEWNSTAVIDHIRGFVTTSIGSDSRDLWEHEKNIARALGWKVTEVQASADIWGTARARFTRPTTAVDAAALAKSLAPLLNDGEVNDGDLSALEQKVLAAIGNVPAATRAAIVK